MKHSKREESSIPELCEEVIEEIMLRQPLKSLGNCKLVSKSWNSLISKPEFAKAHAQLWNRIGNPPSFIALQKFSTISMLKCDSSTDMITPLDRQFGPHSYGACCFLVGSCDGLVCLYFKKKRAPLDMMYLWNPGIDKHKQIMLPAEQGLTYLRVQSCWFGFVSSLNTYKIFLVYNAYRPLFVERKYVCTVRNNEWREIFETNDVEYTEKGVCHPYFATEASKSIMMNEVLHLLVDRECLHMLDLVAETFERVPLSIKLDVLGVVGENKCLCGMVIHNYMEMIFDLWILEEYNKWDSWKRLYTINLQTIISRDSNKFFGFTNRGYLCVHGRTGLKLIDLSQNPPLFVIDNIRSLPVYQLTDHVESLVSPLSLL